MIKLPILGEVYELQNEVKFNLIKSGASRDIRTWDRGGWKAVRAEADQGVNSQLTQESGEYFLTLPEKTKVIVSWFKIDTAGWSEIKLFALHPKLSSIATYKTNNKVVLKLVEKDFETFSKFELEEAL